MTMTTPYKHEPFTNFQDQSNVEEFKKALATVNEYLGKDYPLVINGEKVETEAKIVSINPADKEEVVGKVSKASQEHAEQAIEAAAKAFEEWRYTSLKKERPFCSAQLPKSAAESTNSPPCSSRKRENLGTKLMRIRRKPSTLWNTTRAKWLNWQKASRSTAAKARKTNMSTHRPA
ncbi:Hypothetical protein ACI5QL_00332 [Bacillus velezensis]